MNKNKQTKNEEHLDEYLELCKSVYLRLKADGTLDETLEKFSENKQSND